MPSKPPAFTALQTPMVNPQTGMMTWTWIKQIQQWQLQLSTGFDSSGNLIGNISTTSRIVGRDASLGTVLQNLDDSGVVTENGLDFSRPYRNKTTDNILDGAGSPLSGGRTAYAAMVASHPAVGYGLVYSGTAWQPHPMAQTTAALTGKFFAGYDASTGAFEQVQPLLSDLGGNAELSQMPISGQSVTVTLAKLTTGGANGSLTFTNGVLTAYIQPT